MKHLYHAVPAGIALVLLGMGFRQLQHQNFHLCFGIMFVLIGLGIALARCFPPCFPLPDELQQSETGSRPSCH